MKAMDVRFIERGDGPAIVEGFEQVASFLGISFSELKRRSGFSDSTFTRWSNYKRRPRKSSRKKMLDCVNTLITGEISNLP